MSALWNSSPQVTPTSRQPSDVLESRLFHRLLVLGNAAANWPPVVAVIPVAIAVGVTGIIWWVKTGDVIPSAWAGITLLLFIAADGLILLSLPRLRISFGPVAPQWYILAMPRLAVGCLLAFVTQWTGTTAALAGLLTLNAIALFALLWGALWEPSRVGVSRVTLHLHNPTSQATPVRLLHISDVHVERIGRREETLLQRIRETHPDVILVTGDYINLSYVDDPTSRMHARKFLEDLCDEAAGLSPPPPIYAVLGSPPVDRNSASLFEGLPIRLLRNEIALVEAHPGCSLALIGVDCSHDVQQDATQLEKLASETPKGVPRILMYHSPELMPLASRLGIELYLCGHTHGGQIRLPLYGALVTSSQLGKRYEMGLYCEGNTHLYVSRGVGLEGLCAPRVRFLCPPEIILWQLYCPARSTAARPL